MADADEDYIHSASDDEYNAEDLPRDGGRAVATTTASSSRGYGTRAKGRNAAGGGHRAKERWESSITHRVGFMKQRGEGEARIAEVVEAEGEARKRARIRQDTQPFQRGIIRHLVLILDLSEAMLEKDMRPSRYVVTLKYAQDFVREFFEQNPISQLAVLGMHDGICIRICDLSGNPNDHITAIAALRNPRDPREAPKEPKGSPSLQNALEMSRGTLYHTPSHGTREVIIVLGALLTLDPGDIHDTIKACVKDKLRVSIIGMGARLRICQEICERTNSGSDESYGIAIDQPALQELLMRTTTPPVIRADAAETALNTASLLVMGFPSRVIEKEPTFCACHGTLTRDTYPCSRCNTKVCALPATCPSCGLTLILSTHLARSYHHLFPLRNWKEVSWERAKDRGSLHCKSCLVAFPKIPDPLPGRGEGANKRTKVPGASESGRYACEACGNHFCVDCDLFCHEVVHNCPGCLSDPPKEGDEMVVDGMEDEGLSNGRATNKGKGKEVVRNGDAMDTS